MNLNNQLSERDVRIQKTKTMLKMWVNPYAQSFEKKQSISDIKKQYQDWQHRDINDIIVKTEIQVKTAGRVMLHRSHGKLAFAKLLDSTDQIQLMFHRDNCKIDISKSHNSPDLKDWLPTSDWEMSAYKFMEKMIDVWDFIWVSGEVFVTHKWELTIFVSCGWGTRGRCDLFPRACRGWRRAATPLPRLRHSGYRVYAAIRQSADKGWPPSIVSHLLYI